MKRVPIRVYITAKHFNSWDKIKRTFNKMKAVFKGKDKYSTIKSLCHAYTVKELQSFYAKGDDFSNLKIRFVIFSSNIPTVLHSFLVDTRGKVVFDYGSAPQYIQGLKDGTLEFIDVPAEDIFR